MTAEPVDVLVVGAGPTGLALAAQLRAYGVRFRIVDRATDRVRESRALAIQPRTLEALAGLGVTDELVERGNPAVELRLHLPGRTVRVPLFDIGCDDTPYPHLLFLSQAVTEEVLGRHLATRGTEIERGTALVALRPREGGVSGTLRRPDGTEEEVRARYAVGCDGARSTVRTEAGIGFEGHAYPQTFLLADLEVDGLEPGSVHSFLTASGVLFFFPLGTPATWRMLAMRPPTGNGTGNGTENGAEDGGPESGVDLADLQALADAATGLRLHLRDPVWLTDFRIHNRGATRYRSGNVFLAGDAAHIHSPAGAQGMNTGIQDALNLGWKLALVCRGAAPEELLRTYEAERAPVGRAVRRFTDRIFRVATGRSALLRLGRSRVAPRVAPLVLRSPRLRARVFRTVSELGIHYRGGPAGTEGRGRPAGGPRAGDRLPDSPAGLQALVAAPGFHLLLCGTGESEDSAPWNALTAGHSGLLTVHRLASPAPWPRPVRALVRPDGYLGHVAGDTDMSGLLAYLDRWLPVH